MEGASIFGGGSRSLITQITAFYKKLEAEYVIGMPRYVGTTHEDLQCLQNLVGYISAGDIEGARRFMTHEREKR